MMTRGHFISFIAATKGSMQGLHFPGLGKTADTQVLASSDTLWNGKGELSTTTTKTATTLDEYDYISD